MKNNLHSITNTTIKTVAFMSCVALFSESYATEVKIGGYIKLDAMVSNYDSGSVAGGTVGRDFYVPATVPVGEGDGETYLDFHSRSSRLNLKAKDEVDGKTVSLTLEMDFLVSAGGDERISNSYNPRMRHAFFTYDKWLMGQTWTTFQNVGSLPESLDFLGPAESTVFARQSMVRYTNGGWQFALENPETTVTSYGATTRIVTDDNILPDVVLRYSASDAFVIAAIARQLRIEEGNTEDETFGGGISVSGKITFGNNDDIRYMVTGGSGLGRYIGLNTTNDAALDEDGSLQSIDTVSGYIAYRHFWSEKWRSNFSLSAFSAEYDDYVAGGMTETSQSAHVNILFSPAKPLTFGAEIIQANRETKSGADGGLTRLQFSAKYAF